MGSAILTFESPVAAAEACGDRILEIIGKARRDRGVARVALSGGSTPRLMFQAMATRPFDWSRIEFFQVDERCVPPEHELSNFRMIRESLLDPVHFDENRFHRIRGEMPPEQAAIACSADIRASFELPPGELPEFDLVQRGMGADGHTASLFPGEPLLENQTDIAAAVWSEKLQQHRVTLLPGVLRHAHQTLCLATGADKAEALYRVMRGPRDPLSTPAQIESPGTVWYIDRSAAARLGH